LFFFSSINSLTFSPQSFTSHHLLLLQTFSIKIRFNPSTPLPYTALHFTSVHFTLLRSLHFTSPYFTSLHFTLENFSLHFRLFTSLIYYNKVNKVYSTTENTIQQHSYLSLYVSANHPQRYNLHILAGIEGFTLLVTKAQSA